MYILLPVFNSMCELVQQWVQESCQVMAISRREWKPTLAPRVHLVTGKVYEYVILGLQDGLMVHGRFECASQVWGHVHGHWWVGFLTRRCVGSPLVCCHSRREWMFFLMGIIMDSSLIVHSRREWFRVQFLLKFSFSLHLIVNCTCPCIKDNMDVQFT